MGADQLVDRGGGGEDPAVAALMASSMSVLRPPRTAGRWAAAPRRPDQVDDAIHFDNLDWSLARVGDHLGVNHAAVLNKLRERGIPPETGPCFDNAVAESFFVTLKTEIGTTVWATRNDARRDVFAYLGYYNHDRLHSTLSYRTPHEVRVGYRQGVSPSWHEIRCPVFGDNLT
jgi:hypothetical protein